MSFHVATTPMHPRPGREGALSGACLASLGPSSWAALLPRSEPASGDEQRCPANRIQRLSAADVD